MHYVSSGLWFNAIPVEGTFGCTHACSDTILILKTKANSVTTQEEESWTCLLCFLWSIDIVMPLRKKWILVIIFIVSLSLQIFLPLSFPSQHRWSFGCHLCKVSKFSFLSDLWTAWFLFSSIHCLSFFKLYIYIFCSNLSLCLLSLQSPVLQGFRVKLV